MGTPLTSSTMSGVGYASACWASIHPKPRSPATPSAAGVRRQASSRNRPCLGNVSPSSPIRARGMYDRYGRTLAYLDKADGWDYSVEAARAGAAHSYVYHNHPAARADEIAAAEQEAKAADRGLWGPPCFGQTTSVPI